MSEEREFTEEELKNIEKRKHIEFAQSSISAK